jgi:hypothetical protein
MYRILITLMALLLVSGVSWAQEIKEPPVTVPNAQPAVDPVAVDPVAQAIGMESTTPKPLPKRDDPFGAPPKPQTTEKSVGQFPISSVAYPATSWRGRGWRHGGGHGWWGDYHHASTAAEGYLSGWGRLYRGYGQYLVSSGMFLNLYQDARHKSIINHRDSVHTWWQLKDEYKERFRRDHPTWPERQEKRFDMAIRVHEVKEKEKDLIAAGILPPKEPQSFTYQGRTYPSYEAFKRSADWIGMKIESLERTRSAEDRRKERELRFQQALKKFEDSRGKTSGSTY